jgi:hypothetical protein
MARLIGGILGNVSGKIGEFTVRTVNGKSYISARPEHYNISNSPKSLEVRKTFAVTGAFSRTIAAMPALREIWTLTSGKKAVAYNIVFKNNFKLSSSLSPTEKNIITPYGFYLSVISLSLISDKLTGSIDAINKLVNLSYNETGLSINSIICLIDPKNESDPYFILLSLAQDIPNFDFSKQYDFEIDLNPEQSPLVAKYKQKIIYLAVATKATNGKVIQYSRSYSQISG